jgi:predicted nuclease with TOPRIM domain
VENFEKTIAEIKKIATQVLTESTSGTDVTEQYVDLQAQLKNKRAEEAAFVKILDKSGTIEDTLKVTKELSRVRGEIERLEGRVKLLESQADMSTISINLSEDVEIAPIGNDWRPWQVIKNSVKELMQNMQDIVDGLIRFIIVVIPSFVPFLLFLWVVYWVGKKIYLKVKNN